MMVEGFYVVFDNDSMKHCRDKFFPSYERFSKWLYRYQLLKYDGCHIYVERISDPVEFAKLCEVFNV